MDEYTITEFSIFYKRLTIVENTLKTRIITCYAETFGERAYAILYRYIKTLIANRNAKDKTFTKIFKSNKSESDKLIDSVNQMYLGEILNIFANPVFLKNKKIAKNFFSINTITNSTEFQQKQKALKDFRNCIAHCNTKKYFLERNRLIKGLVFFEKILKCNVLLSYDILEKLTKSRKLSVNEILTIIYHADENYFKDDRLLIILFDDIALINGYIFKSLPQRWSIIRQKFEFERNIKNNIQIKQVNLDNCQMSFQFDDIR